jgi:biopolymer transport protein TolQ
METTTMLQAGVLQLITQAGPVVQGTLVLLVLSSVVSWAIIFAKSRYFKRALRENSTFLEQFWGAKSLEEIYSKTDKSNAPVANVFKSGFKELQKLSQGGQTGLATDVDNIQRALMRASTSEVSVLEKYVPWLATTASAAPFVGLFGTVWGIMGAFQGIGASGSANLAVVAPHIAEALIATAIGLAAAIPAVVAYNHFVNQMKKVVNEMDCFSQDFLNIVQRGMSGGARK